MRAYRFVRVLGVVSLLFGLGAALPAAAGEVKVGKNPGQTKGRWLKVDVDKLKAYDRV